MIGEAPPYSGADYEVFVGYHTLFLRWQETEIPDLRQQLSAEMAELDPVVARVASAEAADDLFAEAYVVGHALVNLSSSGNAIHTEGNNQHALEISSRETAEDTQTRIFGLLIDAVNEIIPVAEDDGTTFDLDAVSFLPQFTSRHLQRVAHQVPGLRDELLGATRLGLRAALLVTLTHHAPDLLEGNARKRLPGLTDLWLESDEGEGTITEVSSNRNKIRTDYIDKHPNKRRTTYTRKNPVNVAVDEQGNQK